MEAKAKGLIASAVASELQRHAMRFVWVQFEVVYTTSCYLQLKVAPWQTVEYDSESGSGSSRLSPLELLAK